MGIEIETEIDKIMIELGMSPLGSHRAFGWLKELILFSLCNPDSSQDDYLEEIGRREHLTRECVRQALYKAVWNNWNKNSIAVTEEYFGHPIQTEFRYLKPNHIEFVALVVDEIRKKYEIK